MNYIQFTTSQLPLNVQVLRSALVVREDADIGLAVVGDIYKKSKCAQLRLGEAIEILSSVRETQLNLLYSGLGLQTPSDDIAEDVTATCTFLGEFVDCKQCLGNPPPNGFIAEVQDAMKLEGLDCVPPPTRHNTLKSTTVVAHRMWLTQRRIILKHQCAQLHVQPHFPLMGFFAQCTQSLRALRLI